MSNELTAEQLKRAQEKFDKYLQRYPEGVQIAMYLIMPNLLNGCGWGFVSEDKIADKGIREDITTMAKTSGIQVFKLKNGAIVNVDFEVAFKTAVDCSKVVEKDLGYAMLRLEDFNRARQMRESAIKGLSRYLSKLNSAKEIVGFYNLNDSPSITIQGNVYKSFNVDIMTLCQLVQENNAYFVVGGTRVQPARVIGEYSRFLKECEIAPSGNSLLCQIGRVAG